MYEKYLVDAGLTHDQSRIYEAVLKNGPIQVARISLLTGIERTLVYKNIKQLLVLNLIENVKDSKILKYIAKNPKHIEEIVDDRARKISTAKSSLEAIMGEMISDFNLISGKPNVRFFEGKKGIWKILDETLDVSEDEIVYQFVDLRSVSGEIAKINEEYLKIRRNKGVKKRIIIPETKENEDLVSSLKDEWVTFKTVKLKTTKLLDTVIYSFKNKVAFITFRKGVFVGVVIDSISIKESITAIFDLIWDLDSLLK